MSSAALLLLRGDVPLSSSELMLEAKTNCAIFFLVFIFLIPFFSSFNRVDSDIDFRRREPSREGDFNKYY